MYQVRNDQPNAQPVSVTQPGNTFTMPAGDFAEITTSLGDVTLVGTGSVRVTVPSGSGDVTLTQGDETTTVKAGDTGAVIDLGKGKTIAHADTTAEEATEAEAKAKADEAAKAAQGNTGDTAPNPTADDAEAASIAAGGTAN